MTDRAPASVLSDGTIMRLVREGRIKIDPWDEAMVQPASVDLRLGDSFRVFHNHRTSAIDLRDPPTNLTEEVKVADGEPFVIHPGEFCLGRTLEWVELPDDIVARIEGKSSLGPPRPDRPRHRRLLRSRLEGHADARAQQPHARADQALRGAADRPALVHDARRAGRCARTATSSSAATTRGRSRRPRAATARPRRNRDRRRRRRDQLGGTSCWRPERRSTPATGTLLGTTDRVLDNAREQIFDGIVMKTEGAEVFVDAPEVGRITERRVTLTIDAAEAAQLPAYEPGAPEFGANVRAGAARPLLRRRLEAPVAPPGATARHGPVTMRRSAHEPAGTALRE